MARHPDRTHRCTDLDLLRPLWEEGYQGTAATANMLGVPYEVLRRVTNGQTCTEAEEALVRQAWASYSPDAVHELVEVVLGAVERGEVPHAAHSRQLRAVIRRLMDEVVKHGA